MCPANSVGKVPSQAAWHGEDADDTGSPHWRTESQPAKQKRSNDDWKELVKYAQDGFAERRREKDRERKRLKAGK